MPTVTATPFPVEGYVLVKTDWRDTLNSGAAFVAVYRVNEVTGEEVLLRPYVAYNSSGCQMLHCGQSLFWDTEPPLNTPIHYRAEVCLPFTAGQRQPLVYDTFSRVNAATWNATDSGDLWSSVGGLAADYSVDGARGVHSPGVANTSRNSVCLTGPATSDGVIYVHAQLPVLPLTANIRPSLTARFADANNQYRFEADIAPAGTVTATIRKNVAGVVTTLATQLLTITHNVNNVYIIRASLSGTSLGVAVWLDGTPEPVFSQAAASDASLVGPIQAGPRTDLGAITNPLPVSVFYDNYVLYGTGTLPASVISGTVEVVTESIFLKSPLHPCSDLTLVTCGGARIFECEPENATSIIFSQMSEESFPANTVNLAPVNRRRVIPVNRERRDIEATLTLVTRTFADRDAVRAINRPGDPLLFQAPAEYGVEDRYMSVSTVTEARGLPDHKIQPRLITLPHVVVDRPEGPADGVCGTRFGDLCDVFTSWDAIGLAGLTWEDLLEGEAGDDAPGAVPSSQQRTWQEVLDDFADWGAVNDGIRTWQDLRDGA